MKYDVAVIYTLTQWVEVEAESEEEAEELACNEVCPTLCHQCARLGELHYYNSEVTPISE